MHDRRDRWQFLRVDRDRRFLRHVQIQVSGRPNAEIRIISIGRTKRDQGRNGCIRMMFARAKYAGFVQQLGELGESQLAKSEIPLERAPYSADVDRLLNERANYRWGAQWVPDSLIYVFR